MYKTVFVLPLRHSSKLQPPSSPLLPRLQQSQYLRLHTCTSPFQREREREFINDAFFIQDSRCYMNFTFVDTAICLWVVRLLIISFLHLNNYIILAMGVGDLLITCLFVFPWLCAALIENHILSGVFYHHKHYSFNGFRFMNKFENVKNRICMPPSKNKITGTHYFSSCCFFYHQEFLRILKLELSFFCVLS